MFLLTGLIIFVKGQIRLAREENMGYAEKHRSPYDVVDDKVVSGLYFAVRPLLQKALPF